MLQQDNMCIQGLVKFDIIAPMNTNSVHRTFNKFLQIFADHWDKFKSKFPSNDKMEACEGTFNVRFSGPQVEKTENSVFVS